MIPESAVPVSLLPSTIELEDIFLLPALALREGWIEQDMQRFPEVRIATDRRQLYFAISLETPVDCEPFAQGEFAAGLWQKDVGELFFGTKGSDAYFELNLSPTGAWWLARFSRTRQVDQRADYSGLKLATVAESDAKYARSAIRIPLADLGIGIDGLELNACAICGADKKSYFSLNPAASAKPDFHVRSQMQRIKLI